MSRPPTLELVWRRADGQVRRASIDLELAAVIVVGALSLTVTLALSLAPPVSP